MSFDDYRNTISARQAELKAKGLPSSITEAQWSMLKMLWDAQGQWVDRELLHSLVQQSDYRRRLTELQDERGIDIERRQNGKSFEYRLATTKLNQAFPRAYLSQSQKKKLFEREEFTCQICGAMDPENNNSMLQADHRIPLKRGGGHSAENWQTLCGDCNVGKRRACQDCNLPCYSCTWAFPDQWGVRAVIPLSNADHQRLNAAGIRTPEEISVFLMKSVDLEQ